MGSEAGGRIMQALLIIFLALIAIDAIENYEDWLL